MKKHTMRLTGKAFDRLKSGNKKIEARLYDMKRREVLIDDEIEFKLRGDESQSVMVRVVSLHRYKNFERLFNDFPSTYFGYDKEHKIDYNDMYIFFSKEQEGRFGVLGIGIELI